MCVCGGGGGGELLCLFIMTPFIMTPLPHSVSFILRVRVEVNVLIRDSGVTLVFYDGVRHNSTCVTS